MLTDEQKIYELSLLFLRVQIDILSGQENFDQCISRICFI